MNCNSLDVHYCYVCSTTDDLGFKVFDKITFKKPNFRKPRVEVPPSFGFRFGGPENVGPSQGFDNPMYGNNPLEVSVNSPLNAVQKLVSTGKNTFYF